MADTASPQHFSPPPTPLVPRAPVTRPTPRGYFSPVWVIPIISALLGGWLVLRHYSASGPRVTVRFETAEGIIAEKTPVLCRSVNVGAVSKVTLDSDNKNVIVSLDMTHEAARLLVDDSQIWVVRARYSSAGISGLNTLLSGNYIELQPGVSKKQRWDFVGLENPPPTPPGVPGVHFKLMADQAGGLGPGSSIIYRGIEVGKLETRVFHPETGQVEFAGFMQGDYARLVNGETRFYNSGGLDLKIGAEGVQLRVGSLESLLTSSVTFTDPPPEELGAPPMRDGHTFTLFSSLSDAKKVEFNPTLPYLLLFSASVRGLSPDAPVEFRGIRVGSVIAASFKYLPSDPEHRVPVLIKLDPSVFTDLPEWSPGATRSFLAQSVANGLRASLKTGSLLTGQLFVELDFQKDAPPATIVNVGDYQVLPTVPAAGLDELQAKVGALLDKFNALPVEKIGENANAALAAVKETAVNLNKLTGPESSLEKTLKNAEKITGELSGNKDIGVTLHNLRETSSELNTAIFGLSVQVKQIGLNLTEATDTVKRQPWRLIWPTTKKYPNDAGPTPPQKKATPSPRHTRQQ
jgi:paraquat-inducible protein B